MTIDFENIKSGSVTKELILSVLEKLYLIIKSETPQNIIINEYVDNMIVTTNSNIYTITLKNNPISVNDIFIVSENGETIITPFHIQSLEENKVYFISNKIKNKINFFVTYKY